MIHDEIEGMEKVFDHIKKMKRAKDKYGPVIGYYYNDYFARIDVDSRIKNRYMVKLKINEIEIKERFETFEYAYMYLIKAIRKYRLFLIY